ncbi:VOC family protein [Paenibacillus sp. Y412MC10]|uniref:VOC family protein n=1 Tax=Geobacillus sp. (strain Y412MC10) TaxID=481743 RepID=UPI0001789457|nr:VOC family protein [Paenibacillus sp. Y412MC10]ACX63512.1 Glyoxalase/bleomycin resistance protein/dioxygenase [Paenibacillus sp. Y412MC10]
MTLRMNPYLVMDGNAKEAIQFYEKALDAQVVMVQTFGEMPANPDFPLPDSARDRISHALLKVGETDLMFSDTFPGQPVQSSNQVQICIMTDQAEQAKRIYEALREGGQVVMPLQETFWSPAYGIVADKFGVNWNISTEAEA